MTEKKLEELENCFLRTSENPRGILINHKNDLSERTIKNLQHNIDHLYNILDRFCDENNLAKEEWSLRREVSVKASFLWEELCDAQNRKFAEISEQVKEQYDKTLNDMLEAVNTFINTCNENL